MLHRVAVFAASPSSSFLTLELELFLRLSIGKSQEELDTVMLVQNTVEVSDDTFGNLASLKSEAVSDVNEVKVGRLTERIQLPCSHQKECLDRSW